MMSMLVVGGSIRLDWIVAAAVGLLVVGALAVALVRWSWGVREVARGLEALGRTRRARPVLTRLWGPVGGLVRAFNVAGPEIAERFAGLERDGQQLRVVLGAMAEAVIAVDARFRLLFANTSADEVFGLERPSEGRLIPELIRSPQVQDVIEATFRLISPDAHAAEIAVPSTRGPTRILAVRGTPLPGTPPPAAVFVFHDVTELRRLERMRQDFVANASHELKTPLASIKAYAETLLDGALNDDAVNVRFLIRIEEQADRLNQLVLDLISLARLESGQDAFQHRPLLLVPALLACIEPYRERAAAHGLGLVFEPGGCDAEVRVVADEEAIRQIFDNLIDNAIKYTPDGGTIRISCREAGREVVVEVADTGIGIPRDDLPRIFERFYRVDKARSRELGGTGLGLSIVKHLVQSIGGRVAVSSRIGTGSEFSIRLPKPP
jgi:two-component system phosphate regulon sensor histidine kinase PhoR